MGYRIADKERVIAAIETALARKPRFESQHAFGDAVRSVLHEADDALRASDQRIRRVAVQEGLVQVQVQTGSTDEPAREACPVCASSLEKVKNQTLDGGQTVVGATCPSCPYSSGPKHEVPVRYAFGRSTGPDGADPLGPF